MVGRAFDDKLSDTLVVVSGEGFWTGSSTLPHLHHFFALTGAYAGIRRAGRQAVPLDGSRRQSSPQNPARRAADL